MYFKFDITKCPLYSFIFHTFYIMVSITAEFCVQHIWTEEVKTNTSKSNRCYYNYGLQIIETQKSDIIVII